MHSVIQNWGPVMVIIFTYLIGVYLQVHIVESLRREMNAKFDGLRGEMLAKIDAVRTEMDTLRAEVRQALAELRLEFHTALTELSRRVEQIEEGK